MNDFFNCVVVNNGLAFGTGVILFLFTLLLASKRVFGFFFTLIFLLISLGGAMAVKNREGISNYIQGLQGKKSQGGTYTGTGDDSAKSASIVEQLQKAYDDLKVELADQKQKIETYFKESKEEKNQTQPEQQQNRPPQRNR